MKSIFISIIVLGLLLVSFKGIHKCSFSPKRDLDSLSQFTEMTNRDSIPEQVMKVLREEHTNFMNGSKHYQKIKDNLPEYYQKYCIPLYMANPDEAYNGDDVFHKNLPAQKIILLAKSIHNLIVGYFSSGGASHFYLVILDKKNRYHCFYKLKWDFGKIELKKLLENMINGKVPVEPI